MSVWQRPPVQDSQSHHTTRYIDRPTVNLVLVRQVEDTGHKVRMVFDGNDVHEFGAFELCSEVAKAMSRNSVPVYRDRIPRDVLEAETPVWLNHHAMEPVIGIWEEDGGVSFGARDEAVLRYSPEGGLMDG